MSPLEFGELLPRTTIMGFAECHKSIRANIESIQRLVSESRQTAKAAREAMKRADDILAGRLSKRPFAGVPENVASREA